MYTTVKKWTYIYKIKKKELLDCTGTCKAYVCLKFKSKSFMSLLCTLFETHFLPVHFIIYIG